ncbi:MAG: hypothetical protein HOP15_11650 [Planctomycetes bacterium]|nr:hypothetical protein [Planctomycetota bacterium]
MSKSTFVLSLALLGGLALSSCASIVSKSDWPVTIDSNPSGAMIKVINEDGKVVDTGVTPFLLTLSAKDGFFTKADYDVEATLAGYNTAHSRMSAQINGWYFGNVIFGGLIGLLIVDPATGAMWKMTDRFTVNLQSPAP